MSLECREICEIIAAWWPVFFARVSKLICGRLGVGLQQALTQVTAKVAAFNKRAHALMFVSGDSL